jgi:hypothetical protein
LGEEPGHAVERQPGAEERDPGRQLRVQVDRKKGVARRRANYQRPVDLQIEGEQFQLDLPVEAVYVPGQLPVSDGALEAEHLGHLELDADAVQRDPGRSLRIVVPDDPQPLD